LLQREPKKSGTVKNADADMNNAAQWEESWDGYKELMEEYDG
jgi:hypothetical protein